MFIWAIIIHSFNKLFCFSYIFLRWDYGVHVIKHMQTFQDGDCMKASNLCNFVKICWEIASDLVLNEENREKQTILAIVCTNTSTRVMKRILLWLCCFSNIYHFHLHIWSCWWEIVTLDEHTWFMISSFYLNMLYSYLNMLGKMKL